MNRVHVHVRGGAPRPTMGGGPGGKRKQRNTGDDTAQADHISKRNRRGGQEVVFDPEAHKCVPALRARGANRGMAYGG